MPTALAPKPTRATSSITLSWALVSIPLSIYAATEDTGVQRSTFHGDNPVGYQKYDKVTGQALTTMDITAKAQASDGSWVVLNDDEVMAITQPAVKCEVVSFIPLDAIGSVYLVEKYYQVRPKGEKGNVDPNVAQGFALLLATMARRQVAALIKVAMRGPARYAAVLPDGRMVTLLYADGVRASLPMPQVELPDAYLAMADTLIDSVGIDLPSLDDTNGAAVRAYVDAKAAGNTPTPPPATPQHDAQSLLDNLMASVEASKKAKAKTTRKPKGKAA